MSDIGGRAWRSKVALCLATFGDICHLCLHPGATSADHLLPRQHGGTDALENLRPAHSDKHPCPACGLKCNQVRGSKRLTPQLLAQFRRRPPRDHSDRFLRIATPGHPAPAWFYPPDSPQKKRDKANISTNKAPTP